MQNGKILLVLTVLKPKQLTRKKLLPFLANVPKNVIGLEGCGSAHYWARQFSELGHEVKLMAPKFVKPYLMGEKNDANDSAGIYEALTHPRMRFVAAKTLEQQDIQAVHRIREQIIKNRTALANQLRGLLGECGITICKGITRLRREFPSISEDATNGLTSMCREMLHERYEQLRALDTQVRTYDCRIDQLANNDPLCQRLPDVEGIGTKTAADFRAAVGDPSLFNNGREVTAWLGLVPRQNSSGGKVVTLGITKQGGCYLRKLLIHGARSAVQHASTKQNVRSRWLQALVDRRGTKIAAAALVNKNARILWALLAGNEQYRHAHA